MVFFSAVFAARAPAMGNSADRAWQLSQLVEGVSTACNPSAWQPVLRRNKLRIFRFHASTEAKDTQLASTRSSRAPCAFPNLRCDPRCWLFSCLGLWSHPHISPKEHQKERCGHYSAAALLHYFSWCASRYSVAGRIFCYVLHDNVRTNVCQWPFAENFHLLIPLLNQIDSISNLYIFT